MCTRLWGGKRRAGRIGDPQGVLELLWLLLTTILAWVRPRQDLVLENLLLRHQLAVLTRPTRTRPPVQLRIWDKVLWVLARQWCAGWHKNTKPLVEYQPLGACFQIGRHFGQG